MTIDNSNDPYLRSMNLLAGGVLLLLLLVLAGFLRYSWVAEKESAIRELSTPLRFAAQYCEGYFKRIEKQHRILGLELLQQNGQVAPDKAIVILNNYKGINHDQRWFSLVSASGEVIAETDTQLNKQRPYFLSEIPVKQLPDKPAPDLRLELETVADAVPEESLVLPFRYAIRDSGGELKYVVRSRLRLSMIQDFWKTALIPQESVIGFMHHQGHLINSYSANPGGLTGRMFSNSAEALASYLQASGFPTSGSVEIPRDGMDWNLLVMYQKLTYYPLTVFVSVPMSYVGVGWWGRVKIPLILACALFAVGFAAYRLMLSKHVAERRFFRRQTQLKDVAQGILTAQEEERARLSHELHDEVGQSLTALKITLNRAQQNLANHEKASALLGSGQEMVEEMVGGIREIAYRLRPSELDQLGLVAALRSHIDKTIRPLFPNVALSENVGHQRFNHDLELCCFRIAQEALTNCLRHAKATQIDVSLDYQAPRLTLAIKDNGVGFDAACYSSAQAASGSLGLIGMRERVAANGGQLWIVALPEGGTQVTAHFHQIGEL
ncbi:sensor histidine kinase [Propionivibrio limicola]|uniref:sensor histidine kinase n=1 Tax=Propionivibrio limicola TaxID=167645 RepID=UPI00129134FA|nr:histidine kinase [Propionivibrio limicola]